MQLGKIKSYKIQSRKHSYDKLTEIRNSIIEHKSSEFQRKRQLIEKCIDGTQ